VPELVVGGALLRVLQDLVGLVDFLEPRLGAGVTRVLVRVVLHCKLPIGPLQVGLSRALIDAQNLVIIAFACHEFVFIETSGQQMCR
jgi:hypothetical protein